MKVEHALKIVHVWGRHLDQIHGRLMMVFMMKIPESLLPFPLTIIEEAVKVLGEHFESEGRTKDLEDLRTGSVFLMWYIDDTLAIEEAAKNLNNPKWRDSMIPGLRQVQQTWVEGWEKQNSAL